VNAFYMIVGALCISKVEGVSKVALSFPVAMSESWPYLLVGQYCLFVVFNTSSSIMSAWLGFTITMSLVRLANSCFVLNEGLDMRWAVTAVSIMMVGALCMKQA